jgi:predicted lipid-binding transport protein (Tim44 family)
VRHPSAKSSFPAGNPIANLLVIIGGALAIGVSIVLGFFAFVALGGIILLTAAVIGVRVWWFKRKLQQGSPMNDAGHGPKSPNGVIEGEYRVVSKDREEA